MSIAIKASGPVFFQWRPGATPRRISSDPLKDLPGIPRMKKEECRRKKGEIRAGYARGLLRGFDLKEEGRNQDKINTTSVSGIPVGRNVDGTFERPIVTRWPD